VPVSVAEFEDIERQVADGSYEYNVVGYQKFSVAQYKSWVAGLDRSKRF
jgi:urea carboxylase